jgi:hypothetical protein
MRSFAFHIDDDRRLEPVVRKAHLRDAFAARELAGRMLRETYHHRAVAVWEGAQRVWIVENQDA